MADYSNQRASADRMLTKFGKAITFTREVMPAYDPNNPNEPVPAVETATGVGVLVNYSNSEIDGTMILSGDRKIIYRGEEPQVNDQYGLFRVVTVMPVNPAEEADAIINKVQVRKAT